MEGKLTTGTHPNEKKITTKKLAAMCECEQSKVRRALCIKGHHGRQQTDGAAMKNEPSKHLNTNKFADLYGVKGSTVRRALCMQGHYLGYTPIKLPNGRLLWPNCPPEKIAM
jgi:hypothetical protein